MSVEKTPSSCVQSKSILVSLPLWAVTSMFAFVQLAFAQPAFAQKDTNVGTASSTSDGHAFTLGNRTLEAKWDISSGKLTSLTVTDQLHQKTITVPSAFSLPLCRRKDSAGAGSCILPEHLHSRTEGDSRRIALLRSTQRKRV